MRPQSLHLARPRRLYQPPWTHASLSEALPPYRRNQLRRNTSLKRQTLFGRGGSGGRGASLREAASPPRVPHVLPTLQVRGGSVSRRGLNQVSGEPHPLSGGTNSEEATQLKRQPLFGREREGGASLREAASLAYPHFPFCSSGEGVWGRGASLQRSGLSPRAPHVPPSFAGIFLRVSNETSYRFG